MVLLRILSWQRIEIGEFAECHVHTEGGRTASIIAYARNKIGVERSRIDQVQIQQFGIYVRYHAARFYLAAIGEHCSSRASVLYSDGKHFRIGGDFNASRKRLGRHRLRDSTHATDRMAPYAFAPVHFSEHMMQQHI